MRVMMYKYDMTKRNYTRDPVLVIQLASENKSLAFALRSGGYPESMARHPERFLNRRSFLSELYNYLEQHPEKAKSLAKYINAGLEVTRADKSPDHLRRLFFSDIGLKVLGYT